MNKNSSRSSWLKKYSAMFLLAALALLACFVVQNKHLVGELDGVHQHFTTLSHIREIFAKLISGEGFEMVSLQIGQGLDTIGTLSYYGLADPLNWIAAFFPQHLMEYAYALIIFVRLYLVGLTFGWYLREIGLKDDWSLSLSAFVYTFSGFFLKATLRHPYFSDGGIYLALMLIATERLLKNRKWLMFVLTTAVMLAANYYFAYHTTLLVIAYIIMRLCFRFPERRLKGTAKDGFCLLGGYILGVMLIAVYFVPVIINFMGNARIEGVGSEAASLLHYAPDYYIKLILFFCAPYMTTGAWMHQNFAPIALIGLISLFLVRAKGDKLQKQIRCEFIIMLIFACIPAVGKVFNGLGYVSNRWCYGFAFAVCTAMAWALPGLMNRENGRIKSAAIVSLVYAAVMLAGCLYSEFMVMLAGSAALIAFAVFMLIYHKQKKLSPKTAMRLLALATVLCCIVYQAMIYLPLGGSFAEDYGEGRFIDKIKGETASAASAIQDDSFFRVDAGAWDDCHQAIHGYNGTSMYWSVVPEHVSTHYLDLQLGSQYYVNRVNGMNGSTAIDALASVKYALRDRDENRVLPYGYEKMSEVQQHDGDTVDLYQNRYALPVGYVFEQTMSEAQYDALNPVEKQAALLSYAVSETAGKTNFASPITESEWTLASADGAELAENTITAEKGGRLTFAFTGAADSETYIAFENLRCAAPMDTDGITLYFSSEAGESIGRISDPSSNYHFAQAGVCVNLGYSESGISSCTLTFSTAGEYLYDAIRIYSLPMEYYRANAAKLAANGMKNVTLANNRIGGSVTLENAGVLQISVPYSSGWTASVNGEEAEIFRCGGMYMGVALESGDNNVELRYTTPGLKAGAVVSMAAVVLIIALCVAGKKKKKELSV